MQFKIKDKQNLTLTIIHFDNEYTLPIYIIEDKKGIKGSSRTNWKKALYNYNRNKKRKNF